MKFYTVLSYTNLIATPLAPAMLYAYEVSYTLQSADYPSWIGWLVGAIAIAGIEGTGALTFSNALKSYHRKNWGYFGLSVFFGLIYAVIMIAGIYIMDIDTGVMAFLVLLTIGGYVGSGVYTEMRDAAARKDVCKIDQKMERDAARAHEIEQLRQQRLTLNAETKRAQIAKLPENDSAVVTGKYANMNIDEIMTADNVSKRTAYRRKNGQ